MSIFWKIAHDKEVKMAEDLKKILDADANFVRPLSDLWNGRTREQVPGVYNHFGLWLSGKGGSMIDGEYAAYYHDKELSQGHKKLKDFMIANRLELYWYDCETPVLITIPPTNKF